jgi:GntR family transcriptional regulator
VTAGADASGVSASLDALPTPLDAGSGLPKYHQLKEILLDSIERRELGENELIPSERDISERYGISRMTVRQAVAELVNEGVLYRAQGRGTFVAGGKFGPETGRLTSFTQDMRSRGMSSSSAVLESSIERAGPIVARALRVPEGERIIRLRRLRYAGGGPMALETSHLVHRRVHPILEVDLGKRSLYEELAALGLRPAWAEQSFEAGIASGSRAEHLGVVPGSPVLKIERVTYDERDRPFEYVRSTYRGDRYRFVTRLQEARAPRGLRPSGRRGR